MPILIIPNKFISSYQKGRTASLPIQPAELAVWPDCAEGFDVHCS